MVVMEIGKAGKRWERNIYVTAENADAEIKKMGNTDVYITPYAYEDGQDIAGSKMAGDMYWDIDVDGAHDHEEKYQEAAQDTIKVITWIEQNLHIKKEMIEIYFSGNKGFHIVAPTWIQMKEEWVDNLNDVYGYIARRTKEEACATHVDTGIYDRRRLLRMENTINSKSGLYKVAVSYQMLTEYTMEDMRVWASTSHPEEVFWVAEKKNLMAMIAMKILVKKSTVSPMISRVTEEKDTNNNVSTSHIVSSMGAGVDIRNDNIQAICDGDYEYYRMKYPRTVRSMNMKKAAEYINSNVDMNTLLDLPKSFCCIFHNDKKPSAWISAPNPEAGYNSWMYHCSSGAAQPDKCKAGMLSNIDCVKMIQGVEFKAALKFLCLCLNIQLPHTVARRHIDDMIAANLKTYKEIGDVDPHLKHVLNSLRKTYNVVLQAVKDVAEYCSREYYGDDVYLMMSKRYLNKLCSKKKTDKNPFRHVVLLAALGLIVRVPDASIPDNVLNSSRAYLEQQRQQYDGRTTQYYRIISIDNQFVIRSIKHRLCQWIDAHAKLNEVSYNVIEQVYGKTVADQVYVKPEARKAPSREDHNEEVINIA